ncbi:MAG: hypothetical protein JXX14_13285 [Deltaproteobacteria bacterium]|nr:hypothetical protein [Deltaproteobacteria bacterium]
MTHFNFKPFPKSPRFTAYFIFFYVSPALLWLGCNNVVAVLDDDTATEDAAQSPLMEKYAGIIISDTDTSTPVVYCGLSECAENEICCFAREACFNPLTETCGSSTEVTTDFDDNGTDSSDTASAIADTLAQIDAGVVAIGELCNSNADCAPDAFCRSDLCLGNGTCQPRVGDCTPKRQLPDVGSEFDNNASYQVYLEYLTLVCGCDGRNYESECAAFAHGVRVSAMAPLSPCGGIIESSLFTGDNSLPSFISVDSDSYAPGERTLCNPNADVCAANQFCCPVTFTCMRNLEAERCFVPEITGYPCTETYSDCGASGWEVCQRPGCGDKGSCVPIHNNCNELSPVCGCNGISYLNICAADEERVSVAYDGECSQ